MPIYNNPTNRFAGKEFLKIPPLKHNYSSIFYYKDEDITDMTDTGPYYNPIKFKQVINFVGDSTTTIEIP